MFRGFRPGYGSKRAPRQGRVGGRAALANLACGCKARLKGLGLQPVGFEVALAILPSFRLKPQPPPGGGRMADEPRACALPDVRRGHGRARGGDPRGQAPEGVWLLEHPSLYTAGTSAAPEELIEPSRFPVFRTGRGGRFTYHGPGQRVAYVMLDLTRRGRDVRAFVHALEDWLIATLAQPRRRGRAPRGADRHLCRRAPRSPASASVCAIG